MKGLAPEACRQSVFSGSDAILPRTCSHGASEGQARFVLGRVFVQRLLDAALIGAEHCRYVLNFVPIGAKKAGRLGLFFVQNARSGDLKNVYQHPGFGVSHHGHGVFSIMVMCSRGLPTLMAACGAAVFALRRLRSAGVECGDSPPRNSNGSVNGNVHPQHLRWHRMTNHRAAVSPRVRPEPGQGARVAPATHHIGGHA